MQSPFLTLLASRHEAEHLVEKYRELKTEPSSYRGEITIDVAQYSGANRFVSALQDSLSKRIGDYLAAILIHGSIGSGEETAYSDFDALVILNDVAFESADRLEHVARELGKACWFMRQYDPLQHHGWFVLTPFDLDHYCEAYFPLALFEHAKSLFPDRGRSLSIHARDSQSELEDAFGRMAQSIELQLIRERYPRDMYALKSFLSRLMLLPALYVQARDGKGVWKADSFGLARGDFDERLWHCIETATEIRAVWRYDVPTAKRWLMVRPDRLGSFARRRLSGGVPAHVGKVLDHAFYQSVKDLIREMRTRVASKDASPMPVIA